jgi:hypothetical protein
MQLTEDFLKRWEEIVNQVDKEHIPIECVKKIIIRIEGGKQKTINLRRLKDQGLQSDEIHDVVDRYVQNNSDNITNMEFVLDIQAVAELLQPETDKLLQGIT